MRRLVHCTLPPELDERLGDVGVRLPILHDLVRATSALVNVRRANVDVESGVAWFLLELSGPGDQLDQAEEWLTRQGITVEPIDA